MALSRRARVTFRGGEATAAMRKGAAKGLRFGAEHVLGESRKVVPHEEGTLERSGTASVDADSLTGAVSYDTPYAVYQHEELDLRHDAGRQAKYLEEPLEAEADTVGEIVAAQIRQALE